MRGALLPAGGGSLLVDPMQVLQMLGLARAEVRDIQNSDPSTAVTRPVNKAYDQTPKPLTAANYLVRPDQLSQRMRDIVNMVAGRAATAGRNQMPAASVINMPSGEPSLSGPGVSFNSAFALPAEARNPVAPHNFNINVLDRRPGGGPTVPNVAEAMMHLNPQLRAAASMQPPQGVPQAPEAGPLQTGGPDTSVPTIAALDPSFGQPQPEAIAPPQVQGMPQLLLTPPPDLASLPPVPHNFINSGGAPSPGPTITAPAPAPTGPGGPVAMLRFPVGHTPAISMGQSAPMPPVAMGGPTQAETVPPAVLQSAPRHIQIGAGYRRPALAQMPIPVAPPPIDDALTGLEANRRFMSGPGPGTSLEYPPPSLPSSPAPAAPATISPSPPNTVPDTGAAVPGTFEDNLIKAALMLSAKRKAMATGAHG